MKFRLGETYENGTGASVRIIATDATVKYGGTVLCPIVGEVTNKGYSYASSIVYYDENGHYCGLKTIEYKPHCLISNDPTEEELDLIRQIGDYCERRGEEDQNERLLKIVRQLRKK